MSFRYKYISAKEIEIVPDDGLSDFFWTNFKKAIQKGTMETKIKYRTITQEDKEQIKEKNIIFKWR